MHEEWEEAGEAGDEIPATPVFFAHARAYPGGYVIDVADVREGAGNQFAMEWSALPQDHGWTPHQAVEFFIQRMLPRMKEIIEDRDIVLYFDCLSLECPQPHLLNRALLEEAGLL